MTSLTSIIQKQQTTEYIINSPNGNISVDNELVDSDQYQIMMTKIHHAKKQKRMQNCTRFISNLAGYLALIFCILALILIVL